MSDLPFPSVSLARPPVFTLRFGGKLVVLDTPKIMGIINVTPDSFYEGSRAGNDLALLKKAENMLIEGADFLDIGGYSTRPGATFVSGSEETNRVTNAIAAVRRAFSGAIISVDSFRPHVAKAAVEVGADWVNDVSGGVGNADMLDTVAALKVPYIQMHIRREVEQMHQPQTYRNIEIEVAQELATQMAAARKAGITDVVADPGFGFSKSAEQNFELLAKLEFLHLLHSPLLAGVSRKSMVYKTLQTTAEEALNGTTALHTLALLKGVHILRVHDVAAAVHVAKMVEMVRKAG